VATDLIDWSEVQPHLHDIMTLLKPSEVVRQMMDSFHERISHGRYTHTHTHTHTRMDLAAHWRRGDRACDTMYDDVTLCMIM